jgi:hypothetical protein
MAEGGGCFPFAARLQILKYIDSYTRVVYRKHIRRPETPATTRKAFGLAAFTQTGMTSRPPGGCSAPPLDKKQSLLVIIVRSACRAFLPYIPLVNNVQHSTVPMHLSKESLEIPVQQSSGGANKQISLTAFERRFGLNPPVVHTVPSGELETPAERKAYAEQLLADHFYAKQKQLAANNRQHHASNPPSRPRASTAITRRGGMRA